MATTPTRPSWADCPPAAIASILPFLDGQTMYSPAMLTDAGVPAALAARHTQTCFTMSTVRLGSAPRQIECRGISSLPVLGCIVHDLGLVAEIKRSRTGQAIAYRYVIKKWLESQKS